MFNGCSLKTASTDITGAGPPTTAKWRRHQAAQSPARGPPTGDYAATVAPNTGSTSCTNWTFQQYTKYHGSICYTNPGDDNLYLSGYWTTAIYTGCSTGYINFFDANGGYHKLWYFTDSPRRLPRDTGCSTW